MPDLNVAASGSTPRKSPKVVTAAGARTAAQDLAIPAPLTFWIFITVHVALWTLVPILRNHNLPLDVIEHLAWGREWQLGYHKHPPMVSWMLEAAITLFGKSDLVIYGLSQLCIGAAFFAIWRTAVAMLAPVQALVAVLLCEGVIYHGFTSPEFNVNVASLPFWAVAIALSHRLYSGQQSALSTVRWILLGIAVAGAVLAKYTGVLLGMCIVVLFATRPGWHWWRTSGPYYALSAFFIIIIPHIIWLIINDFPTFSYAVARGGGEAVTVLDRLSAPLGFLGSQTVAVLPAIVLALLAWKWQPRTPSIFDRDDLFLIFLGLGPLIVILGISLTFALELKSMWGTTLFLPLGIMIMRWLQPSCDRPSRRRLFAGVAAVLVLAPLAYLLEPAVANGLLQRPKRTQFPGVELARVLESQWHRRFGSPFEMVVGDEWLAGNVSFYAGDRPSAFLNADPVEAPWASLEQLADAGGIVVWTADKHGRTSVPLSETKFSMLQDVLEVEEQPPLALPWATSRQIPQVFVGWAIIPPQELLIESAGLGVDRAAHN